MRFFAGVVVGIVIGRPVLTAVNKHLTPPVRRQIRDGAIRVYNKLGEKLDMFEQEEER